MDNTEELATYAIKRKTNKANTQHNIRKTNPPQIT